jgi:hypothetical protein
MDRKTEAQLRQELADVWALLEAERSGRAAAVAAERERCKVLARWMIEATALLAEYEQTDDSEDGGATARDLRWRGERLVQAVLDPGPNVRGNLPP